MSQPSLPPPSLLLTARNGIPNALTLTRLILGLLFPFLPSDYRLAAFLAAVATEFLDGTLARYMGAESIFGQILDPIADKTFLVCVLGTLLADHTLAPFEAILLIPREIIVLVGSLSVALFWGRDALARLPAAWPGKIATAVQLALLLYILTGRPLTPALLYPAALLSLYAGIDYVVRFLLAERRR